MRRNKTHFSLRPARLRKCYELIERIVSSWTDAEQAEMFVVGNPAIELPKIPMLPKYDPEMRTKEGWPRFVMSASKAAKMVKAGVLHPSQCIIEQRVPER